MDLSDISRERTLIDLDVARVRILDLTVKIDCAAAELAELRTEVAENRPFLEVGNRTRSAPNSSKALQWSLLRSWRRRDGTSSIQWHVDEVCGQVPAQSKRGIEHLVRRNNSWVMSISGWAVPKGGSSTFTSARLLLTGPSGSVSKQVSIHSRDDVAAHFGNPGFAMSGFEFEVPMSELAAGSYLVDLAAFAEGFGETTVRLGRIQLA